MKQRKLAEERAAKKLQVQRDRRQMTRTVKTAVMSECKPLKEAFAQMEEDLQDRNTQFMKFRKNTKRKWKKVMSELESLGKKIKLDNKETQLWRDELHSSVNQCQESIKETKSRIRTLNTMLQTLDKRSKDREVTLADMGKTLEQVQSNVHAMKQVPMKRTFGQIAPAADTQQMFKRVRQPQNRAIWVEENATPNLNQTPPIPIGTPQYTTREFVSRNFAPR